MKRSTLPHLAVLAVVAYLAVTGVFSLDRVVLLVVFAGLVAAGFGGLWFWFRRWRSAESWWDLEAETGEADGDPPGDVPDPPTSFALMLTVWLATVWLLVTVAFTRDGLVGFVVVSALFTGAVVFVSRRVSLPPRSWLAVGVIVGLFGQVFVFDQWGWLVTFVVAASVFGFAGAPAGPGPRQEVVAALLSVVPPKDPVWVGRLFGGGHAATGSGAVDARLSYDGYRFCYTADRFPADPVRAVGLLEQALPEWTATIVEGRTIMLEPASTAVLADRQLAEESGGLVAGEIGRPVGDPDDDDLDAVYDLDDDDDDDEEMLRW